MRKTVIGLGLAILFASFPALAETAPRAGATCKMVGSTKDHLGKRFVCVKVQNKKIWSRGKKIQSAQPKTSQNPSSSSKPSSSPIPAPTINFLAGDLCQTVGQRIELSSGYLECREVVNKSRKYFQLSNNPKAPPVNFSPESLDVCRIPDQSKTDRSLGPSIAYPIPTGELYARIPKVGPINALIIPIDFSDSPGVSPPSLLYREIVEKSNEWMKWYSNGKSYYNFQTYDKWIRATRKSSEYVPDTKTSTPPTDAKDFFTGNPRDKFAIASEYLDLAKNYFDYRNAHTIFFLYPRDVKIWSEFWGLGINEPSKGWKTTDDPRLANVWINSSSGRQTYYNFPIWAFFLHENLHNQGLQGHAPNQGSNFGIMTNQYGLSLPLTSWDALIIDWQIENQFYCVQKENLKPTTLTLSPLEREEIGTKAIMIKLSNSQVLVIESRRKDKWSSGYNGFPGLPNGFYGVLVYKVDTTATPLYGIPEPDGSDWRDSSSAFAYLIRNLDVDHGYIQGAPQSRPVDMNFVLYEGETLITNGISISLVRSGDHDQVKIERS